jgi:hypothetical protein
VLLTIVPIAATLSFILDISKTRRAPKRSDQHH